MKKDERNSTILASSSRTTGEFIFCIQPDRNSGRKLICLERESGDLLGYVLLETSCMSTTTGLQVRCDTINDQSDYYVSTLRGMEIDPSARGSRLSTLLLGVWLWLCSETKNVTPATVSINKPLLALTLMRFGFTPIEESSTIENSTDEKKKKKKKKTKVRKTPLVVEVSRKGLKDDKVYLFCSNVDDNLKLKAGFTKSEIQTQNLALLEEATSPRGRTVHIRTKYQPPPNYIDDVALYGLCLKGNEFNCVSSSCDEIAGILTGRLRGFND